MNDEYVWMIISVCVIVSLSAGLSLWFLLPRKLIVWSDQAIKIMPNDVVPPWAVLNLFGKTLYILFISSNISILVVLINHLLM